MAEGTGTGSAGGSDAPHEQYELEDLELSGELARDVTGGYSWEEFKDDVVKWTASATC